MRLAFHFAAIGAFALAAGLSFLVAVGGARQVEQQSVHAVNTALSLEGIEWVQIGADGLQVLMAGTAPDEAARFHALRVVGEIVDSDRIIDSMGVLDPAGIEPPRFSLEMLRNVDGVSLIGLIPASMGRDRLTRGIDELGR